MDDIIQNLSLRKVRKAISNLEKVKWDKYEEGADIDEFVNKITTKIINEFGFLPNIKKMLDYNMFSLKIFRVRELDSFKNIDNFSEHSYAPINVTKNLGRCNMPFNPVFYCSDNPITALLEVVRENNYAKKKYCISTWELIPSVEHIAFQTFLQSDLHEKNDFNALKKIQQEQISEPFENSLNKEQVQALNELLKYLDSQFIKNNYSFSASFAHQTLYAKHNLRTDILMYPSIQTKLRGVNMAIHPNFVDNNMRVSRFYIIELKEYDIESGKFNIELNDYGHIDKNVIMWSRIRPNNKEYEKYFKEDFSQYINEDFKYQKVKKNETQHKL